MNSAMQTLFEGKIDFHGQKLVEQITKVSLVFITILSFVLGFVAQSLRYTFTVFGIGTALLAVVVLPPWPMYNLNPPKWLSTVDQAKAGQDKKKS